MLHQIDAPFVSAHLLRRHPISFAGTNQKTAKLEPFVPQREHVTHADNSQNSWNFCHELKWYLSDENKDAEIGHGKLNCTFVMGLYKRYSTRVKVQLDGPLINWLVNKAGPDLQIQVLASGFGNATLTASGLYGKRHAHNFCTSTPEMHPRYLLNKNSKDPIYEGSFSQTPKVWLIDHTGLWSNHHEYHLVMDVMVFGKVKRGICLQSQLKKLADNLGNRHENKLKEMFIAKKHTDMEVIASDATRYPCHKGVVIGVSDKLNRKLAGNSDGDYGGLQSLLLDNNAASVSAFVACRYGVNMEEALKEGATCIDVLKITQEFELFETQEDVKNILMTKFDCFTAAHCLELFRFAKDKPSHEDLKEMALGAMKMKRQELLLCVEFGQLFTQDQRLAVEVLNTIESMAAVLTEVKFLPD